jgi:rhodanese-related sulfurtransferase
VVPLQLDQWRDERPIVFYCRSGARSAQACAYLMSRGYEQVLNLRGGVLDWVRNGLSLVPPGQAAAAG